MEIKGTQRHIVVRVHRDFWCGQVGEVMDGRYEVFSTHGKGVFSTVLRAHDKAQTDASGNPLEVGLILFPLLCFRLSLSLLGISLVQCS